MPTKTILVEDSIRIREVLIPSMEELGGMRVVAVAETVEEATAAFERHGLHWDVAIVDLFLRQGSGLDVLRACRHRLPHQHVIMLTNYATAEVRGRCLSLGADAVFDKSTELDAFFELCASYERSAP
jgi:DNA-binding NarL/FixJ family response regulator